MTMHVESSKIMTPRERACNEYDKWIFRYYHYITTTPKLRSLASYFHKNLTILNAETIHMGILDLMEKSFLNKDVSDFIIESLNDFTKTVLGLSSYDPVVNPVWQKHLQELNEQGYTRLPSLPKRAVATMREYFESQPVGIDQVTTLGPLSQHDRDKLGQYTPQIMIKCPHFLEVGCDSEILSLVEAYLGSVPTNNAVCTWWSFADRKQARDAQLFHYDYDDFKFIKLFCYLTDVDEDGGPHVYVPGTHRVDRILSCANSWGNDRDEFIKWYMPRLRKTDDDVKKYFEIEPVELTGEAGTCFLVDTRGIHKGKLPIKNDRLMFQFQFGTSSFPQHDLNPLVFGEPGTENFPSCLLDQPYAYTHRFLVQLPIKNGHSNPP